MDGAGTYVRALRGRGMGLFRASLLLVVLWLRPPFIPAGRLPAGQNAGGLPAVEEIERDLLAALNRERASRGLTVLRVSPEVVRLARRHSAEMAARGVLSHVSATGQTFTDRLAEAAVLFAENGENVARSGTYVAELIHQSFMASEGHRENVLNPGFDEVGIGIVLVPDHDYFVTEDFIRSLVPEPAPEVRARILGALNEWRVKQGLPALELIDEVGRTAETFARDKAAGQGTPPVPSYFGAALVRFAAGPDLEMIEAALGRQDLARYGRAGLGVSFGRGPGYPGGAYFVCAVFIQDDGASGPGELARALDVLKTANAVRAKARLELLELDADLAREADALIAGEKTGQEAVVPGLAAENVFVFVFGRLDSIDRSFEKRLQDPRLRRIGISTLPIELIGGGGRQGYVVAVILAN